MSAKVRHACNQYGPSGWGHCIMCDGRIHMIGCTSKRNKKVDCCPQRHKMLFDAGQVRGIADDSFIMWSPEEPEGYHSPEHPSTLLRENSNGSNEA